MTTVFDRRPPLGAPSSAWSPARLFLVAAGIYLLVIGTAGFLYDASFPIGSDEAARAGSGQIFGIFETNGWHNLAGLVFGILAVAFALKPETARAGALVVGVPNALVLIAFALEDPRTFWFASNGADSVVHALLGFGGIAAALATRSHSLRTEGRS